MQIAQNTQAWHKGIHEWESPCPQHAGTRRRGTAYSASAWSAVLKVLMIILASASGKVVPSQPQDFIRTLCDMLQLHSLRTRINRTMSSSASHILSSGPVAIVSKAPFVDRYAYTLTGCLLGLQLSLNLPRISAALLLQMLLCTGQSSTLHSKEGDLSPQVCTGIMFVNKTFRESLEHATGFNFGSLL